MYRQTIIHGAAIVYSVINPNTHDAYPKMIVGKTVKEIAQSEKAVVAMNFNFASTDIGVPIGRLIIDGKIVNSDIPKTTSRYELYLGKDNKYNIGKAPSDAIWAVQGTPPLVMNGKKTIISDQVKRDQTPNDIANSTNYRVALGYTKNNELVFVRTVSKVSLSLLQDILISLNCVGGINGDGGGSTYLWPYDNGWGRLMGMAVVVKEKAIVPPSKKEEELNVKKPVIKEDFIPVGRGNRPGYKMVPEFITIHETGNKSRTADAENHANYLKGDVAASKPVSWHFTVDDKKIIQHLPLNENGWAAGDGSNGTGNRKSIQIEMCENEGVDLAKVHANTVKLVAYLLELYNKPTSVVVQHNRWSGKNCPAYLRVGNRWATFIAQIEAERKKNDPLPQEEKPVVIVEGFKDIHGHWAESSLIKAAKAGVLNGVAEGIMAPDDRVTRAQLATVLDRIGVLDELIKLSNTNASATASTKLNKLTEGLI